MDNGNDNMNQEQNLIERDIVNDSNEIKEEYIDEQKMEDENISENDSRILEIDEINESERNIIKGDTIGETLYSAKWILKTLIQLTNVDLEILDWNESMEKDLCILWDMSQEKEIVEFLLDNEFYKIAELTLKGSKEPRLMEIIVGIIGNMCCKPKALEVLIKTDGLSTLILTLISSTDSATVIQVLRIYQATLWDIQKNADSPWLKKITEFRILGEAIIFILQNSLVEELVIPTIDLVYLITDIELPGNKNIIEDIFDVDQLMLALSESMINLTSQEENSIKSSQLKSIENWYSIIFNTIKNQVLKFSEDESSEGFQKMNIALLKTIQPYTVLSNLVPANEACLICIEECIKLVYFFQRNELTPNLELIKTIVKVMMNLKTAACTEDEFETSDNECFNEIYTYSEHYWIETLIFLNMKQILEILQRIDDSNTLNDLVELTKTLIKIPEDTMNKFIEACHEIGVNNVL